MRPHCAKCQAPLDYKSLSSLFSSGAGLTLLVHCCCLRGWRLHLSLPSTESLSPNINGIIFIRNNDCYEECKRLLDMQRCVSLRAHSRTGLILNADRKIACDKSIPKCQTCLKKGRECMGYGLRLSWPREDDQRRSVLGIDPARSKSASQGWSPQWEFVNVFSADIELYNNAISGNHYFCSLIGPLIT